MSRPSSMKQTGAPPPDRDRLPNKFSSEKNEADHCQRMTLRGTTSTKYPWRCLLQWLDADGLPM